MRAERGSRPGGRLGGTAVEMAVVLNVLLMIILGTFESGRLLMTRHLMDNATREAARAAVSGTYDLTEEEIRQVALHLLDALPGELPTVLVYRSDAEGGNLGPWDDAGFGERIAVRIEVEYIPIIPGFGILPETILLKSLAIMRSEGD